MPDKRKKEDDTNPNKKITAFDTTNTPVTPIAQAASHQEPGQPRPDTPITADTNEPLIPIPLLNLSPIGAGANLFASSHSMTVRQQLLARAAACLQAGNNEDTNFKPIQ